MTKSYKSVARRNRKSDFQNRRIGSEASIKGVSQLELGNEHYGKFVIVN